MRKRRQIFESEIFDGEKNLSLRKDRYDEYFDLVFKHKLYFSIIPH